MCRAHVFPQHILPLLPLYNAQWWGYESLTAIVLVLLYILDCAYFTTYSSKMLDKIAYPKLEKVTQSKNLDKKSD